MRMQNNISIYLLILISSFVLLANSCKKDDNGTSGNQTNGKTTAVLILTKPTELLLILMEMYIKR
jgi:hypothetical protein